MRTTLTIPEDLLERLRLAAAEQHRSMADLVRQMLEEGVKTHRPRPRSLGIGASGFKDTARRIAEERPEPRSWR
ncbi:MAG: Plasmid stability protein [Chloroflexi bacterium]|nr:MAG: Plasmid stability protein [Chloroflexota bacterium]